MADASQATSPLANGLVFKHMRTARSKKEKKKLRNLQFVPLRLMDSRRYVCPKCGTLVGVIQYNNCNCLNCVR